MSSFSEPKKPKSSHCQDGYSILCSACNSSQSFLDIFEEIRFKRKVRGALTDKEQDLLRAMLMFASSGLDSLVKQLIKDALPKVIHSQKGAEAAFKEFSKRKLKQDTDHKLITEIMTDKDPRSRLIEEHIKELSSRSLQSTDQILTVAASFDIPSEKITKDKDQLSEIFNVRNQIAHEMDIDLAPSNRNRRQRKKDSMIKYTNEIFRVSKAFLNGVDSALIEKSK